MGYVLKCNLQLHIYILQELLLRLSEVGAGNFYFKFKNNKTLTKKFDKKLTAAQAGTNDSPSLPGQNFLRLWIVDEDIKQVLLLQDKKVGKAVCFHVSCAPVSSIFGRL